jgi:fructose-bisphosphate aldolase class II
MKEIVKDRLEAFGAAGQIDRIGKVYSLEAMAAKYGIK